MAEEKKAKKVVEEPVKASEEKAPKAKKASGNKTSAIQPRLKVKYENEVRKALLEQYKYESVMQIPALSKIVINIGCGDATQVPHSVCKQ